MEPLVAYPPIPRAVIKEEPLEEQECDGHVKLVIAYPPISRGRIKEESPSDQDEFNLEDHQVSLGFKYKKSTVVNDVLLGIFIIDS